MNCALYSGALIPIIWNFCDTIFSCRAPVLNTPTSFTFRVRRTIWADTFKAWWEKTWRDTWALSRGLAPRIQAYSWHALWIRAAWISIAQICRCPFFQTCLLFFASIVFAIFRVALTMIVAFKPSAPTKSAQGGIRADLFFTTSLSWIAKIFAFIIWKAWSPIAIIVRLSF